MAGAQPSPSVTAPQDGTAKNSAVTQSPAIKQTLKEAPALWAEQVKTRAQERWQLIAEKKYGESHAFLSTASRAFQPRDEYSANVAAAQYSDAIVNEAVCADETCTAVVTVFVLQSIPRVPQKVRTPIQIRERWIVEDGDAYLLQR